MSSGGEKRRRREKSTNEFHEFASQFKSRFNELIKDYETLFAYEEYKYTFYPTLNEKG